MISVVGGLTVLPVLILIPGIGFSLLLALLGVFRAFFVSVPEGVSGLLASGGRYTRTIGSGTHIVPPWIAVTHLVTRREIPFDVPVVDSPTRDGVRVSIDTLLTLTIEDPYRFVFNISADDFDQILLASCQEALRTLVRSVTVDEVINLGRHDTHELREIITADVEPYGVQIAKIKITYAQPPAAFFQSQEERQLAVVRQAEQVQKQSLAERQQADQNALERQRVLARIQRERDELEIQIQRAEASKRIVAFEAEAEALRLAKLEERLQTFPNAAQWDVEVAWLDVARALAGNTRAVLQVGRADDISHVLLMRDTIAEEAQRADVPLADEPSGSAINPPPGHLHGVNPGDQAETADSLHRSG